MGVPYRIMTLAVATVLVMTRPVGGQLTAYPGPRPDGAIVGLVVDGTSKPLPEVSVLVASTGQVTRTDKRGAFRLDGLAPGSYVLQLRLLGYAAVTRVVAVRGEPVEVRIEMAALPQTLDTVRVSRRRARLPEVYARESKGLGAVLYSEDIPRYRQGNVSGLLRFAPTLAAQLASVRSCRRVAYLVDGRPLPRGWKIDDYVQVGEIEAIEAHSSADFLKEPRLAQPYTPATLRVSQRFGTIRFGTPSSSMGLLTGTCTRVVMVWTRHYRPNSP